MYREDDEYRIGLYQCNWILTLDKWVYKIISNNDITQLIQIESGITIYL